MKELILKIKFDDKGCYKGHGDGAAELIKCGLIQYLEVDLEQDGIIKSGWSVEVVPNDNDNLLKKLKKVDKLARKIGGYYCGFGLPVETDEQTNKHAREVKQMINILKK